MTFGAPLGAVAMMAGGRSPDRFEPRSR